MKREMQKSTKEVTATVETEVEKFIAEDGTAFDKEYECRFYEYKILKIPLERTFKDKTVNNITHFKCATVDEFRNALLLFTHSLNVFAKSFLYIFWDQFENTKGDWFYFDIDDSGDNVCYSLEHSLDRLGELKEYVQEYSELQHIFLEEM